MTTSAAEPERALVALARDGDAWRAVRLGSGGAPPQPAEPVADLAAFVAAEEAAGAPRWVWADTAAVLPALLARGIRVRRCLDLRLTHAILTRAAAVTDAGALRVASVWTALAPHADDAAATLFDAPGAATDPDLDEVVAEWRRQEEAIAASSVPGALRLLCAAESAGALIAAELRAAGLPWDADAHDALLREVLGDRGPGGEPVLLARAAARVREALGDPALSVESPPKLLRALRRAGIDVQTTSKWELARHDHPAVPALLEYKQLARLHTANGWAWLREWVRGGRFRPVYVPGGVVTGRWASSGGGALQLPRRLRRAVRADPGWCFVIADVAQLEPRVLAAMAHDEPLARAAAGRDLYEGIAEAGAVATRQEAKLALLGAIYGATTGESARLLPRLRRAYPRAMALVEEAARRGERGESVHTLLGRTSPETDASWRELQTAGAVVEATAADERTARRLARDRGRFTRNFVVQGTAAEWALAWMGALRARLYDRRAADGEPGAEASGPAFARAPHLAFFLHDEIIVHAPRSLADDVARDVQAAADEAGRLLFGAFPLDFRLDLRIADSAEK